MCYNKGEFSSLFLPREAVRAKEYRSDWKKRIERIEDKKAADFEAYSIIKGMSMTTLTGRSVLGVVNSLSRQMSLNIIEEIAPDWEATDLIYPLKTKEFVVVEGKAVPGSLGMIEGFAMSQSVLIPVILMMAIYLIPFSHPTIAARALVFGDYLPVIGGMIYMGLFAATLVYITVRIFSADKVLTARFSFRKRKRSVYER